MLEELEEISSALAPNGGEMRRPEVPELVGPVDSELIEEPAGLHLQLGELSAIYGDLVGE